MGLAVTTVAAGGLPVKDIASGGIAVTEVAKFGLAITKVTGTGAGMGVTFVSATGEPALVPATLNGTPTAGIVMSNGNLTAVHGTTNGSCGVSSASFKGSGKYYFEITLQSWATATARIGIILSTGTMSQGSGTNNVVATLGTGSTVIYADGVSTAYGLGATAVGNIFAGAINLDTRLAWFRRQNGLWNGNGTADPATGVNGVNIAAGTWAPLVHFGGSTSASATDQMTANFGASAFVGAVPSGFTAGWPA